MFEEPFWRPNEGNPGPKLAEKQGDFEISNEKLYELYEFFWGFLQPEIEKKGGSGTLIGQKSRFRKGFGPRKAVFSEFQLRSEFWGAGSRIWSI